MAHFDPLLARNRDFATTNAREGTSISAKFKVYVITCLDPRTDPSAFRPRLRREHGADHHHRPGRAHALRRGGVRMSTRRPQEAPDV
jgi:hypothetical protein